MQKLITTCNKTTKKNEHVGERPHRSWEDQDNYIVYMKRQDGNLFVHKLVQLFW